MALARLQAILACMNCGTADLTPTYTSTSEKASLLQSPTARPETEIANNVVAALITTSITGQALRMQLDSLVGAYGWRQNLAQYILDNLAKALQASHEKLGPTIHDAYLRAWEAAKSVEGFVVEHPVMCTVIALGVLAIVAPWILEALGFAELGPAEGSFAAWWQARYAGYVPKGSLFSFFQRLGIKWHWKLVV
ncbi:hypothetical protein COCCADRAFT_41324 [Bipolaris zeicola 26-R-13]|uniref:Lincomycin-condensing protein lmbA n=1 Tax=Cochliobolus carbonum (strain 26-R-13) TaxID=930089 RepID=W6XZE3_COCC2|nr:uncharacterized protein COCCADRAFT_41324 [Bipolaris zeicola 26-R-13]EUC28109.1 hypothetical protein COCCADRAFT_41324 [Bipolaris zeicola 26-R-13]